MSTPAPKIALIHATPAAVEPAAAAMRERFESAELWNLLDDGLLPDADRAGGLTPALRARMNGLIAIAVDGGADGVLLTCSLYGPVAQAASADVPLLAPDEAAFDAVADGGYEAVVLIASFASAMEDSVARLGGFLLSRGVATRVDGVCADAAFAPARSGDGNALVEALARALDGRLSGVDAIVLGQYSLAPAAERLAALTSLPVISGPQAAANRLAERMK